MEFSRAIESGKSDGRDFWPTLYKGHTFFCSLYTAPAPVWNGRPQAADPGLLFDLLRGRDASLSAEPGLQVRGREQQGRESEEMAKILVL